MIIVHIEGGLGNQMMDYAEYFILKKLNPNHACYLETVYYEMEESFSVISKWNGYELDKVFKTTFIVILLSSTSSTLNSPHDFSANIICCFILST